MEIELKYDLPSAELFDAIWRDEELKAIEEEGTREEISIRACYYDTDDLVLSKSHIAFRVRKEEERVVGTLKTKDKDVDESGLYEREEINVPITDSTCFLAPDPGMFKDSEPGREVMELVAGRPLKCIFETVFSRKSFRIDTGKVICEVSLDKGEIMADGAKAPVHEFEIELFTGSKEALIELGQKFSGKYGLEPETRSKYARGMALMEQTPA